MARTPQPIFVTPLTGAVVLDDDGIQIPADGKLTTSTEAIVRELQRGTLLASEPPTVAPLTQTDAITLAVVCDNPVRAIDPAHEGSSYLGVFNGYAVAKTVVVTGSYKTVDNRYHPLDTSLSVPALSVGSISLQLRTDGEPVYGHRLVTYSASWSGGSVSGTDNFVFVPAFAGAEYDANFDWGATISLAGDAGPDFDLGDDASNDAQIEAMRQAGLMVARHSHNWDSTEGPDGTLDWSRPDAAYELLTGAGLRVVSLTSYSAAFAATPASLARYAADGSDLHLSRERPIDAYWVDYVSAYAARYGDKVWRWEDWNEPNLSIYWAQPSGIDDFIAFINLTAATLRGTLTAPSILGCAFASETIYGAGLTDLNPTIHARVLAEANAAFSIHSWHNYGDFGSLEKDYEIVKANRVAAGVDETMPWYLSEVGRTAAFSQQRTQALTLAKKMAYVRHDELARGFIIYLMRDTFDGPTDDEASLGLLYFSLQPRPAYGVVNQVVASLRGYVPDGVLPGLTQRARFYLFRNADHSQWVSVYWSDNDYPEPPITVRVGVGATIVDFEGNAREAAIYAGANMTLALGEVPMLLTSSRRPTVASMPASDLSTVVNGLGPFSRIRADAYVTVGSRISSFTDLVRPGHSFAQADDSARILVSDVTTSLNGAEVAAFNGGSYYTSTLAPDDWDFLHQEGARTVYLVMTSLATAGYNTVLSSTSTGSNGFFAYTNPGAGLSVGVVNASAANLILSQPDGNPDGAGVLVRWRADALQSFQAELRYGPGQGETSGDFPTPSTVTAPQTLALCELGSTMRLAEAIIFDRVLRPEEDTAVLAYIRDRYAVWSLDGYVYWALENRLPACWIRADTYTQAGGLVTAFQDLVVGGHTLSAIVGERVAVPVAIPTANNALGVTFTGGQKYVSNLPRADWNFIHQGDPCEIFLIAKLVVNDNYNGLIQTTTTGNDGLYTYVNPGTGNVHFVIAETQPQADGPASAAHANGDVVIVHFTGGVEAQQVDCTLDVNSDVRSSIKLYFTPSTNDAQATLQLGVADGSQFVFLDLIIYDREMGYDAKQLVRRYAYERYGVPQV